MCRLIVHSIVLRRSERSHRTQKQRVGNSKPAGESNKWAIHRFSRYPLKLAQEGTYETPTRTGLYSLSGVPHHSIPHTHTHTYTDKLQTSGIKLSTESEAACVVPSVTSNALLPESGIGSYTLQQILTDFYTKYDQAKAPQVTGIFHQFHGQYDALFATIASIYPLYFPSPYRERTVSILQKTCPALLPAVDVLLDLHQGREIEFLGDLLRLGDGIPSSLTPGVGSMPSIIPTSMSVADQAASASSIQRMATAYDPLPVSSLASGGGAPSVAGLPAPPPYQASPSPQRSVSFQSSSLPPRAAASPAGSRPLSAVLGKLLSQQGTPHPERVAEILSANFVGYEPQVLKAFEEVSMGKRPGL
ncbi:hypothetical protein DIPPA_32425 [Diplonema papillatum]|nr:hypothetical protein DIPPA_32425 [Diplonema papillatum]